MPARETQPGRAAASRAARSGLTTRRTARMRVLAFSRDRQKGGHALQDRPLPVTRAPAVPSPYHGENTDSTVGSRIFWLAQYGWT